MKKIYSFLVLSFIFSFAYSQKIEKENVPSLVIKQFESMYQNVKNSKWELDFENYQVDFIENKEEKSVWYDKDGMWLKKSTLIMSTSLPLCVKDTLMKQVGKGLFSNYKYDYIEKIETPNAENLYKIKIKNNKETLLFLISETGKVSDEDEDDEH